ncbi:MAG: galactokinase [Anaerolineaceae bacterium]|nr:galactokinase [Anaerolineaceae bacterium]
MSIHQQVINTFESRFGETPHVVVRAPGRVNLIGDHTDYNDGFVLPMAIDRAAWIALTPNDTNEVVVHSLDFGETARFSLADLKFAGHHWLEYLKGVTWALQRQGMALSGWNGVMAGDVPVGAGLSSSAALELATARAFAAVSNRPWDARAMAKIGQQAENEWLGLNTGIMDQLISAAGVAGHALLIDCRSLETRAVPLLSGTAVVVLDTKSRRGLVDSAYNERRTQCETAARFFGVPALRDVSFEQFQAQAHQLDDVTRRRTRHIITENERTLQAAEVLRQGDAVEFGCLMNASHASLRDDFEVTNQALDTIVTCAHQIEGCYGARMTGAGFGGCAVALVANEAVEAFVAAVIRCYQPATGLKPAIYVCTAANGAEVVSQN